ncbi:hypothetical protein [uncultured Anaerococcus sp.]|uniref:hypothetical protein n=1 Tax=uncultured Anaerococcus sp. TaxID=293428 RepID=UPI0028037665|nr:hypothetical protein [uncultured Anaerococcus sp.]
MRKDLVKERILLAISVVFLLINLFINYFPIANSKIILLIVLAWLPIIFLNNEIELDITIKERLKISLTSFLIEVLIILVSAFIFDRVAGRSSLLEENNLITLYITSGLFIIQELIKYFYILRKNPFRK